MKCTASHVRPRAHVLSSLRFLFFPSPSWSRSQASARTTGSLSSARAPACHLARMSFTVWTLSLPQTSPPLRLHPPPHPSSQSLPIWFSPPPPLRRPPLLLPPPLQGKWNMNALLRSKFPPPALIESGLLMFFSVGFLRPPFCWVPACPQSHGLTFSSLFFFNTCRLDQWNVTSIWGVSLFVVFNMSSGGSAGRPDYFIYPLLPLQYMWGKLDSVKFFINNKLNILSFNYLLIIIIFTFVLLSSDTPQGHPPHHHYHANHVPLERGRTPCVRPHLRWHRVPARQLLSQWLRQWGLALPLQPGAERGDLFWGWEKFCAGFTTKELCCVCFMHVAINPLFFFSNTGELPQVLRLLSHDLWALEELLPDISDHLGVQGKASFCSSNCFFFFKSLKKKGK